MCNEWDVIYISNQRCVFLVPGLRLQCLPCSLHCLALGGLNWSVDLVNAPYLSVTAIPAGSHSTGIRSCQGRFPTVINPSFRPTRHVQGPGIIGFTRGLYSGHERGCDRRACFCVGAVMYSVVSVLVARCNPRFLFPFPFPSHPCVTHRRHRTRIMDSIPPAKKRRIKA